MAVRRKQVLVVVSSPNGDLIDNWVGVNFEGFNKELNAGVGECVFKIDKPFDYSGIDVTLGNDIEVRISDRNTASDVAPGDPAKIIYKGYISLIEREINSGREQITIHALGYYTLLGVDILKDGSQTTLYSESTNGLTVTSGSQDAADIGKMMRAVLDQYISENPNPRVHYNAGDIPDTGTTATYRFEQKTYREALDILKSMAPSGTYYYVDHQGFVKMKPKPTTPTHQFIFGRHFANLKVEYSLEKMRNFFLLWNGETGGTAIYKKYQDDASIATFGRRAEARNNYGIDDDDAADAQGAKFLAESKDPEIKVFCSIVDDNENDEGKGYDIEKIEPGDTCSFYGFAPGVSEIFRDNMIITGVRYTLGKVDLVVEVVKSGLLDVQSNQGQEIGDINTGGFLIPESYT